MKTYIALFRGINVGGKNIIRMQDLIALLENLGSRNVKTYIQSGNAVFQNEIENVPELSNGIRAAIKKRYGFEPHILLLNLAEIEQAIASNPFSEAESEPKTLHIYFLSSVPSEPDLDLLENAKQPHERFHLLEKLFYLHAPNGIGRSKLAARVEKALGVPVTARNWRTVRKIVEMATFMLQLA
ncbi:MAG: DUF1697 domain-containing protein [bacterium]